MMKITIIGIGNGGHAFAGALGLKGFDVTIYDCCESNVVGIRAQGGVRLEGQINGFGKVSHIAKNVEEAVRDAEIIFVTTTANAHKDLGREMAAYLKSGQTVVLCPGRTGGALEFRRAYLEFGGVPDIMLAEAQTLVYACRMISSGAVDIIGIKDRVMLAALPAHDTPKVLEKLEGLFTCFLPVDNVLTTSLENIGAIFHPSVVLFNAATIERGQPFYFYRDMTPSIAAFIEKVDAERLAVGKAFGINLIGVSDWISYAYPGTQGTTLCEKMQNNPAYYEILAPTKLLSRQLLEDVPTGVLPIADLGRIAGVDVPLLDSLVVVVSSLLNITFRETGRSLENLGLKNLSCKEILRFVNES